MHASVGSLAVTGVAIVSAGVMAATPIKPPLQDTVEPAVALSADSDWLEIFDKAGLNAGNLATSAFDPPFPITQQSIANQIRYLGELPDVVGILEQIATNVARGATAPGSPSTDTLDAQHAFLYNALPIITSIPGVDLLFQISPTGQMLLDFSASPLSGVVLGLAGPVAGPIAVLAANLQSIIADLAAANPDAVRALNTVVNTPAQMVDAFLNGNVHVDVTPLVEALGPSFGVSFPEGTKVGIAFGGLLSPGGSIFNALDLDYERDILGLPLIRINLATGQGPGFIGSLIEMNKIIAKAIGWDGTGNPLGGDQESRSTLAAVDEIPASSAQLLTTQPTTAAEEPGTSTAVEDPVSTPPETEPVVVVDDDAADEDTTPRATQWNPGQDLVDGLRSAVDEFGKILGHHGKSGASKDAQDNETADSDVSDDTTSTSGSKDTKDDKDTKADKADADNRTDSTDKDKDKDKDKKDTGTKASSSSDSGSAAA
ncbi:hypothetical protein [Mycolicibacterium tokaiense]|uniref:PE-PGRS family protein n=1 Tax=Mycolicibacterium tokaiense TaxID=39695 RepID=A0A378TIQ0_9MYCO|nr:hypothetical protein [Mycolicibacterium tokaiense]BBY84806.1 hypothetical protein MTOK_05880 [Mycolicibacterium tokaiense]STZ60688.1 Uncharacterised protein [Mycolicibacterium tokaiense]